MPTPPPPPRPSPPIPGGNLGTTYVPSSTTTTPGGGTTTSEPGKQLTIPGNILPWLENASASTGVPLPVLAAAVYRETGFNRFDDDYGPALVLLAARKIRDEHNKLRTAPDPLDPGGGGYGPVGISGWVDAAAQAGNEKNPAAYRNSILSALGLDSFTVTKVGTPGFSEDALWTQGNDRALADVDKSRTLPSIFGIGGTRIDLSKPAETTIANINDVYRLFKGLTGRDPKNDDEVRPYVGMSNTRAENAISALPEAADWRKYGSKVGDAKRWAENIYVNLLDRLPTQDELKVIVDRGYGPDTLTDYLRRQPYGSGTIGAFADAKKLAESYAQKELGRAADPGEVNFMVQNGISTPDSISSFYEQMRQRQETGDPSFTWVGNPQQWRDMQATVTSIWKKAGLTQALDPHIVNQAITGKWGEDDIQNFVDAQPAPGFGAGITVGQVNRIRPIAKSFKQAWYPDQALTNAEIQHLMGFSPDQIRDYFGNQPKTVAADVQVQPLGDLTDPQHIGRTPIAARDVQVNGTPAVTIAGGVK